MNDDPVAFPMVLYPDEYFRLTIPHGASERGTRAYEVRGKDIIEALDAFFSEDVPDPHTDEIVHADADLSEKIGQLSKDLADQRARAEALHANAEHMGRENDRLRTQNAQLIEGIALFTEIMKQRQSKQPIIWSGEYKGY
jgi:hypothetical protein